LGGAVLNRRGRAFTIYDSGHDMSVPEVEMNRRYLLLLLPLLLAADGPQPSRVSLDNRPRTLAQAAAEIGRQANVAVDTARADGQKQVSLPLSNVPFWDALDRLARAADQRVSVTSQGARVSFSRGPYTPVPLSVVGPFRFVVSDTIGHINFESGVFETKIIINIAWEPSFKAYYLELEPTSVMASNEQKKPLNVINEGATRVPVASGNPELTIKLRDVPREVRRVTVGGEVKFLGTSQMLQFAFPLADTKPAVMRAEVTGTLASFRKNVRLWTAVVELDYPADMPKLESFQSFLLDNEAWLRRGDGTKFPVKKFELGFPRESNGMMRFPITYYIPENEKEGPVLGNLKDWQLVVRVPGRIVEEKVSFRLQDVPLP
jgi:hypothetical protein